MKSKTSHGPCTQENIYICISHVTSKIVSQQIIIMVVPQCSVPEEARRLLKLLIQKNPALQISDEFVDNNVHFKGDDLPALPGGLKSGALSAACSAALGSVAAQVAQDRFGGEGSNVHIDTNHASYFLSSPLLCQYENEFPDWDDAETRKKPLYACSTNIYPTKDGRWFQMHGDLDCRPMFENIADELEAMMVKYRHSGSKCYEPEEWLATEMGKALANRPLCNVRQLTPPEIPTSYPPTSKSRILEGVKVVEMARIIAGPMIGKTLAEFGAQVIRVNSPNLRDLSWLQPTLTSGSHTVALDARQPDQKAQIDELVARADVFIDGYRPGSLERLGFGRKRVMELAAGRDIIYVDENCYGTEGPYSGRPGWQQIADAARATSVLCALRDRGRKGGSYHVVSSLTALNMFFISDDVGVYPPEVVQEVERVYGFGPILPSDHVKSLANRIIKAWQTVSPKHMDFEGEYFVGFDSGPFGKTKIVAPVAKLEKYPSKWDHPPRPYGYDQPTFEY
ncbi:CoA-transferase family III domain-containing protein [Phascolomyces articulosus]|uniref:CoA-transferase family III domain-containing protein n=1 Tax=Phascolomyces articulosus TaxID=60185 RepID=A0AAD5P930_9FUNG|nr:CoA-transferase family III domain-containing protein [Phascolomyces articulosus]